MFSDNSFPRTIIFVITIVLLLTAVSCSKKRVEQKMPEVTATAVIEKVIPYSIPIVGQVIAKQHVELRARITGFLTKQNFIEGSYVKQGQLLYQIQKEQYIAEEDEAKAAVIKAQAYCDSAIIEYNRQKNLWSTNATSKKDLDNATQNKYAAEASLLNAKAQLALAKLNVSYTDIYAPFDGRIGASTYYPGNLVDLSSKPLAEVMMVDPIWVAFEPREEVLISALQDKNSKSHMPDKANPTFYTKGIIPKLILSNGTEYPEIGIMDFVNNQVDPQTGTIQMRATFKNPQQLLLPGNYVNVIIEKITNTPSMLIPQVSMQNDQIGTYVFTINKNSIVEQKYINIGHVYGSYIVVTSGLNKGDIVATDGILKIRDGSQVLYKLEQTNIAATPNSQVTNGKNEEKENKTNSIKSPSVSK